MVVMPPDKCTVPAAAVAIHKDELALKLIEQKKMNSMNEKRNDAASSGSGPRPDPETLNTTDPQEHMSGPISSTIKGAGEAFETDETKEEADEKRDEHL